MKTYMRVTNEGLLVKNNWSGPETYHFIYFSIGVFITFNSNPFRICFSLLFSVLVLLFVTLWFILRDDLF